MPVRILLGERLRLLPLLTFLRRDYGPFSGGLTSPLTKRQAARSVPSQTTIPIPLLPGPTRPHSHGGSGKSFAPSSFATLPRHELGKPIGGDEHVVDLRVVNPLDRLGLDALQDFTDRRERREGIFGL
jgi:hypothetical protein